MNLPFKKHKEIFFDATQEQKDAWINILHYLDIMGVIALCCAFLLGYLAAGGVLP